MPDATFRMKAARSSSWWEAASASAGASRSVRANSVDMRMGLTRIRGSLAGQRVHDMGKAGSNRLPPGRQADLLRHPAGGHVLRPYQRDQPVHTCGVEREVAAGSRCLRRQPPPPQVLAHVVADLDERLSLDLLDRQPAVPGERSV